MVKRENWNHAGCKEFEEDLVLFHYGELSEPEGESTKSHLKSCAACRESLNEMKLLLPMTISRDEPPDTFWSDYSRQLRQKLDTAATSSSWRQQLISWIRTLPQPALATCAVVLLALTLMLGKNYWENPDAPPDAPNDDEITAIMSGSQDLDLLKDLEILDALDVLEALGADKGKG